MSTMGKIVSTRFTDEQHDYLTEAASHAGGVSVSEFMRRKALERPEDGIREMMILIKELALSILAHNNLELDVMGMDADARMPIIQQYKLDILAAYGTMLSREQEEI